MLDPFENCDFLGQADFAKTVFLGPITMFKSNKFHYSATFDGASFKAGVEFSRTEFNGIGFHGCVFESSAYFFFVTSNDFSDFSKSKFMDSAVFENTQFRMRFRFDDAEFARPPLFLNSTLPDGLSLTGVRWPIPRKGIEKPEEFVQAYRKLKTELGKQKSHEEELNFFGLEMQSRGAIAPKWRPVSIGRVTLQVPADGIAISLYGALSDYGRSYMRPLLWLGLLGVIFWLLYWAFGQTIGHAASFSVINTFGVFGVRDVRFGHDSTLPSALRVLAAVQTVAGTALLFLSLLALQKKFRMK